jgi:DNA-binding HxlR family transcriptional regulator
MLGRTYETQNCSAARTLEIVGERWTLLIIRDVLFAGLARFSDFERSLGIAPNILAKRLDTLVAAEILDTRGAEFAHREYFATKKGLDLKPVVMSLTAWGDRWASPNGPPIVLEHRGCGGRVKQKSYCARCGENPKLGDVTARPTAVWTAGE